jgi:hypothetical protein
MISRMSVLLLGALIAACDSGPSDSELETACLTEGQRGANKMMRREMGVKDEAFCKCVTKESRSQLSAEGRTAMMLDMQGRQQKARAIASKLKETEQTAFMKGAMAVLQTCVGTAMGK